MTLVGPALFERELIRWQISASGEPLLTRQVLARSQYNPMALHLQKSSSLKR